MSIAQIEKRRPRRVAVHDNWLDRPFANFGEQLLAIRTAALAQVSAGLAGQVDMRLFELQRRAAAAGGSEAVPADGGFLVAPEFADRMAAKIYGTGFFLQRCTYLPIGTDNATSKKIPGFDEQSRADGSRFGGVRGYWANEADQVTASRPKYRMIELTLKKLIALSYATDEMLRDAALLGAALELAFTNEFRFKAEQGAFSGTGVGQFQGVLNSSALITVAAETGQSSATIVGQNVAKMKARMWAPSRVRAVWFCHADLEEQLPFLTLPIGTAGSQLPLFKFSESDDEPDRLMGRPVMVSEYAAVPGTVGDLVLVDPGEYAVCDKQPGIAPAVSMHIRFLTDEAAFRIVWRVDGQPMWHTAVTPATGGNTQSPYVALAAR